MLMAPIATITPTPGTSMVSSSNMDTFSTISDAQNDPEQTTPKKTESKKVSLANTPDSASKKLTKPCSLKNLFYLHYLKNLCELISCKPAAADSLKQPQSKKRPNIPHSLSFNTTSLSSMSSLTSGSSDDISLVNYAFQKKNTSNNAFIDAFALSKQLKPILKLAEDFDFDTDHEEDEYDDVIVQVTTVTDDKEKAVPKKFLNCFTLNNG